jgi:outer membrane protein OmpA-like peptidoglycan-associated protein
MKKSTLSVLFLFMMLHSLSQEEKVSINETNINHEGSSLGVHIGQNYLLYSKKKVNKRGIDSYNLYSATIIDSITFDVEKATELKEVNITFSNGSPSVFEDELYYTSNSGIDEEYFKNQSRDFTVNKNGENTLQIFMSKRNLTGKWQFPTYVTFSNIEHNFTTPFITQDGSKLYFSSDLPGGFGGYDIYVSLREEDGSWGTPLNLGAKVNSVQNDVYPAYYNNNLYFSSKLDDTSSNDMYYSINSNNEWSERKELNGFNSSYDEFGICFVNEKSGYFSSNRDGDEYDKTFYFTINTIKEEKLIVAIENKKELVAKSEIKEDLVAIKQTKTVVDASNKTEIKEDLVAIKQTKTVVDASKTKLIGTKTIYFDMSRFRVKSEGRFELDKIAFKMNDNPKQVLEILGFSDASGNNEMNLRLSKKRAKAVEEYLFQKDIASNKLVEVKGYGEKNLINDCIYYSLCGEEANAQNRRVEINILEIIE